MTKPKLEHDMRIRHRTRFDTFQATCSCGWRGRPRTISATFDARTAAQNDGKGHAFSLTIGKANA